MSTAQKINPRTYRIVGPQRQIDERETPHPRVARGELAKAPPTWGRRGARVNPLRPPLGECPLRGNWKL